ncbi:hypothetical protein Aau02nite_63620 [Amorphoplanes auranticolor]|uniref:Uncharacterized protein n=1 Tax=Actinoplanes auranticolor TaxID=47988 RepID=A0A919SQ08_9ACTN|nr:hypothetical protein Aau02nite_63620 [Actinoplanes auranticolor]
MTDPQRQSLTSRHCTPGVEHRNRAGIAGWGSSLNPFPPADTLTQPNWTTRLAAADI